MLEEIVMVNILMAGEPAEVAETFNSGSVARAGNVEQAAPPGWKPLAGIVNRIAYNHNCRAPENLPENLPELKKRSWR
ncbi:hypothetical protein G9P44_000333 [Scheffersomyces stipitis]|nr:hypothetical protein G9P44_000333 [Scheffersomyces stipitis]